MALSSDLASLFVKTTKDENKTKKESTVYGTVTVQDGKTWVQLDGSDLLTPFSSTAHVTDGERVAIMIKNHTAVVTGNTTSPSAKNADVVAIDDKVNGINSSINVQNSNINVINSNIETINSNIETINSNVTTHDSTIKTIKSDIDIYNSSFQIKDDVVTGIKGIDGVEWISTDYIKANDANIENLQADKADITHLQSNYANIDFANIGEAALHKIYADTGLIRDFVVGDQTITGELVGVTIRGDRIIGNTIQADKLVVKGTDGIYYKLNVEAGEFTGGEPVPEDSLHGSIITAKSVTAEKVRVSDLVAFDATIGGFNITNHSLYSGVKESINNTTQGVYLDREGQIAIGDVNRFLKFHIIKDGISEVVNGTLVVTERETGMFAVDVVDNVLRIDKASESYTPNISVNVETESLSVSVRNTYVKLDISADSVMLSRKAKDINDAFDEVDDEIAGYHRFLEKFSKYIRFMEDENGNPSDTAMTIGSGDSTITLEIDNVKGLIFKKNGKEFGSWDGTYFHTGNIMIDVEERAQFGNFAFTPRNNGSLSLLKVR